MTGDFVAYVFKSARMELQGTGCVVPYNLIEMKRSTSSTFVDAEEKGNGSAQIKASASSSLFGASSTVQVASLRSLALIRAY